MAITDAQTNTLLSRTQTILADGKSALTFATANAAKMDALTASVSAIALALSTANLKLDQLLKVPAPVPTPPPPTTPPPTTPPPPADIYPECLEDPSLPDTAVEGQAITLKIGKWAGTPSIAIDWIADEAIPGQHAVSCVLPMGSAGKTLTGVVTATSAGGQSNVRRSNDVIIKAAVVTQPPPTPPPTTPPPEPPPPTTPPPPTPGLSGMRVFSAQGSIAGNSAKFTIATANPGFKIGDKVIVAVGGETGGGQRGTVGVGGVWLATTSDGNLYYTNTQNPKAMFATVIGVNGLDLTLDRVANTTTAKAAISFDNTDILRAAGDALAPGETLMIPMGRFAVRDSVTIRGKTGIIVAGAGQTLTEIYSPPGAWCATLAIDGCPKAIVRDLHWHGNARFHGFGPGSVLPYAPGIYFADSGDAQALDCLITDAFQKAVGNDRSSNVWAYRCTAQLTDGLARYIQWQFQWADCTGGGTVDCKVIAPIMTCGFEMFRSNGVSHIRPSGVNVACAVNTSGNFLYDTPNFTYTADCWKDDNAFHRFSPIFDINGNIDPGSPLPAMGGKLVNVALNQPGYVNAAKDTWKGIVITPHYKNVRIKNGLYTAPPWQPTTSNQGPLGLDCDSGSEAFVDGFKVVVSPPGPSGQKNINITGGNGRNLSVVNSTNGAKIFLPANPTPFPPNF